MVECTNCNYLVVSNNRALTMMTKRFDVVVRERETKYHMFCFILFFLGCLQSIFLSIRGKGLVREITQGREEIGMRRDWDETG